MRKNQLFETCVDVLASREHLSVAHHHPEIDTRRRLRLERPGLRSAPRLRSQAARYRQPKIEEPTRLKKLLQGSHGLETPNSSPEEAHPSQRRSRVNHPHGRAKETCSIVPEPRSVDQVHVDSPAWLYGHNLLLRNRSQAFF